MATGVLYLPAGCVGNSEVATNAGISASKLIHEISKCSPKASGTDVTAGTEMIHTAKGSGSISAFKVAVDTAPTGGDKAYTVDLKKSTGAGAFATVLSAVVTVNSSSTTRTVYSGTVSSATYAAGDIFEVVWAVSGSTGSQGQGALAEVFFEEATS